MLQCICRQQSSPSQPLQERLNKFFQHFLTSQPVPVPNAMVTLLTMLLFKFPLLKAGDQEWSQTLCSPGKNSPSGYSQGCIRPSQSRFAVTTQSNSMASYSLNSCSSGACSSESPPSEVKNCTPGDFHAFFWWYSILLLSPTVPMHHNILISSDYT